MIETCRERVYGPSGAGRCQVGDRPTGSRPAGAAARDRVRWLSGPLAIALLALNLMALTAVAQTRPLQAFTATDTLETLQAKIKTNGFGFTVGHNWVFDMSPAQKSAFLSRHPSKIPTFDAASDDIGPLAAQLGKTLPAAFCWTNVNGHSYIGPVRNQGGCGSCYAFGAIAAAEGTYNYAMGLTDGNCIDLSESFIVWCLGSVSPYSDHFGGCTGADYDYYEMQALVDIGTCREANFPYVESDPGACTHWGDPMVRFAEWHRVPCSDIAAIKTAIMTYGAVDAAVYVDSAFEAYSGGIYENTDTGCSAFPCYYKDANHGISLVGWDDNGGDGYWILRNSWGSSWGEHGYMRIKYDCAVVSCEVSYLVYTPAPGPAVTTQPATDITTNSAVLRATVNPQGLATTYRFEYGVTTNYGSGTPTAGAGSGSSSIAVSNQVIGLGAGLTYHCRIVASNSAGVAYGTDQSFVTLSGHTVFAEGFEGRGSLPVGWQQQYVSGSVGWTFGAGSPPGHPAAAYSGSNNACLYYANTGNHITRLVTPAIDFGLNTASATLSFWHYMEAWPPDQDSLTVYYSTASASGPWNVLASYTASTTPWTKREMSLPGANSTYYLAFEGNAKYGYGVCLDDIRVSGEPSGAPEKATGPSPQNGATGVATNAVLSWSASAGAAGYRVNFGASAVPPYVGAQSGTNFNPGPLTVGSAYYWRIDATNANGVTTGDAWQFATTNPLNQRTLTVVSAYGGGWPGTMTTNYGEAVIEWITNSPLSLGTTQYVCAGATVSGNAFTLNSATNVALTLTNNATLTWAWRTNYWLHTATNGAGTVSVGDGWQGAGSNVAVTATPAASYRFKQWSGTLAGCVTNGNQITVRMTIPRSITAEFEALPPLPARDARFVSQIVTNQMMEGPSYAVRVVMQNTGSGTWPGTGTNACALKPWPADMRWGLGEVGLTNDVAPGATYTFNFTVTAQTNAGSLSFQWRMQEAPAAWFGAASTNVQVKVLPAPWACVAFPVSFPGRQVLALSWDQQEGAIVHSETLSSPTGVWVPNIRPNRWYWIAFDVESGAGQWSLASAGWFMRAEAGLGRWVGYHVTNPTATPFWVGNPTLYLLLPATATHPTIGYWYDFNLNKYVWGPWQQDPDGWALFSLPALNDWYGVFIGDSVTGVWY